uniref:Trafficking protein particle complex subunit 9 (inferred by orthology to a human protein) n=1 Tax=Strongyloides venezuelensis TaxID=75913 RepID=A0A0K0FIK1_STRVS
MKINSLRIAPGFPGLEDHQQIQILVINLGEDILIGGESSFYKLLNRLNDHSVKKVGDQEHHYVYIKFVTQNDPLNHKFANLQVYRRIFAVIGVAFLNEKSSISEIYEKYKSIKKNCDEDALVDNRLLIFGGEKQEIDGENLREIIYYESFKEAPTFNFDIQGLLKNVIIILQSKRLEDTNEVKRCPLLSGEEKYQVGLDKQSKSYKKKCVGRLKKQVGDLHMLLGLPAKAVDVYNTAIENLKSANDLLWLAAAYEGLAVASYYSLIGNEPLIEGKRNIVQRNHTINDFDAKDSDGLYRSIKRHSRRNSDESTKGINTNSDERVKFKGFLKNIGKLTIGNRGFLDIPSIMDKFIQSIENFERFSYSAKIEYQCVIKAASLLFWEHDYIRCEAFLREHIGKYLDDSFVTFNNFEKSSICVDCSIIFKEMNFIRKHAFFSRLAVLFRLHVSDEEPRTENDYKNVYPLLYNTLTGYGIQLKSPLDTNKKEVNSNISGPSQIQVKAIQEVFMSSLRGGLVHSSIRHLCFLLQNYYELLDQKAIDSMLEELKKLTNKLEDKHNLNQIIQLDYCNVLIPAVQWTRFPKIIGVELKPLKNNLDINIITKSGGYGDIFIYSPFQQDHGNVKIYWSVDCSSTVTLKIVNYFHFELAVSNLILLVDGCDFESIPVKLHLPPTIRGQNENFVDVDIQGFPHSEGTLKFVGYSCEILGVKNVVKFNNEQFIKTIRVLPKLPMIEVDTTLEKESLNEGSHYETEVSLFSGQSFDHTITITNKSEDISIKNIRIKIQQPKISGGPQLISIVESCTKDFILLPKESKDIKITIYGIDPTTAPESNGETFPASSLFSKHIPDNISILSSTSNLLLSELEEQTSHDLIPYTGRLLNATIKITYAADLENENNEIYERSYSMGVTIKIVPAITISNWHVLSGEDASTRYIVLDVNNLTDYDAELNYLHDKELSVQAKDTCRVLLLCSCCGEISPFAFSHASQRPSFHMQKEEIEKLRRILEDHVSNHLNIKWSIPKLNINGNVPVGSLLSSVSCLKQLVVPLLTVTLSINKKPYTSEDDIIVNIGDIITFNITLMVSTKASFDFSGTISLLCFHDLQNGEEHIYVPESLISVGSVVVPFNVKTQESDGLLREAFKKDFNFMFRYEGIYKVKPSIFLDKRDNLEEQKLLEFAEKEFFISTASFNVTTKSTRG